MSSPIRILVCDHRDDGLKAALAPLRDAQTSLTVTANLRESLAALAASPPDLIVLDPLSGAGETELTVIDRQRGLPLPVPLLVIGDPANPQRGTNLSRHLRAPWDFALRDFDLDYLRVRLMQLLGVRAQLEELQTVTRQAITDDVTGLLRHNAFMDELTREFGRSRRYGRPLALLILDLDSFGLVNKEFDLSTGNLVLRRVGELLLARRTADRPGRLGGDEFGLLLPETSRVAAAQVVQRLARAIAELSGPVPGFEHELRITASLGFETFNGSDLESPEVLRRHAEAAMNRSKRAGGNRATYFRAPHQSAAANLASWTSALDGEPEAATETAPDSTADSAPQATDDRH
jgi:diguanylate cyclase (GGDEF)-like protein